MSKFLDSLVSGVTGGNLLSMGTSLLGGILGDQATKQTNATNLRIAQETNALNRELAQNANDLNYRMFLEQQKYNSPEQQKKMLLEAGYNPVDLVGGDYHPLSTSPNSATAGNPQIAAQMQAPTAFAHQLSQTAQNMSLMANAQKANEEAKEIGLRNDVFMTKFEKEMEALGLSNDWQKIKNDYDSKNFGLQLKEIGQRIGLNQIQIARSQLEYNLYQKFGEKRAEKEIEHLEQQIKLWAEQGKTEITQQELNKAMGKKVAKEIEVMDVNMMISKYLAPAQKQAFLGQASAGFGSAEASHAQAGLTRSEMVAQDISNAINYAGRGWKFLQLIQEAKNSMENGKLTFASRQKIWQEVKKLGLDISWYDFNELNDNAVTSIIAPMNIKKPYTPK